MIRDRRGQALALGIFLLLVLFMMGSVALDLYYLFETRNWAYGVAQNAALIGASRGRDFENVLTNGAIRIDESVATDTAESIVQAEMEERDFVPSAFALNVRVLPDAAGGMIAGYPPRDVRFGDARGDWSTTEAAVGVYMEVPVEMFILSIFGLDIKHVYVFAATEAMDP